MSCFTYFSAQGDLVEICDKGKDVRGAQVMEPFNNREVLFNIYDKYQYLGEKRPVEGVKIDVDPQKYVLPFHPYSDYQANFNESAPKTPNANTSEKGKSTGSDQEVGRQYDSVNITNKLACRKDIPCCDECTGDSCNYCINDSYCCKYTSL
jgi:hypothetical protein